MQHRENQFVLGAEVIVERHLCDAGFFQNLVDTGGFEAARVKKFQCGFYKIVATRLWHISQHIQTVLYISGATISIIQVVTRLQSVQLDDYRA